MQTFLRDLNWQIGTVFWAITFIKSCQVSYDRLQEVLMAPEKCVNSIEFGTNSGNTKNAENDENAEIVENAKNDENAENDENSETFALPVLRSNWPGQNTANFENLNLEIKKGSLVGVIGPVGSGKTSFLSLLLNELEGYTCDRKFAYVPQDRVGKTAYVVCVFFFGTVKDIASSFYHTTNQVCGWCVGGQITILIFGSFQKYGGFCTAVF